jgi:hypothetical protein
MRTTRLVAPLIVTVLVLAACTPTSRPATAPLAGDVTRSDPNDVVVMGMSGGIGAVDATSGRVLSLTRGAVPEPDWSHVYTTAPSGGNTRVERVMTDTGEVVSSMKVAGDLRIRAVAPSGKGVALMPARDADDAWTPHPRARTTIVVAEMDGASQAERFGLHGNFEPEAFSPDGETLFMLQYRPPLAPTSYRVVGLYLESGRRWALIGPDKQPVENMTATRLVQVASPDGSYLYTLYTNQRPAYLNGSTTVDSDEADERAFVHTVDLQNGFAVCIELPGEFGSVPQEDSAVTISSDGRWVYAIDAERGTIAVVNVHRFRVADVRHADLTPLGEGQIHARVSTDGATLFIAGDAGVIALDTADLSASPRWMATPGPVTGIALSADGARLYVSWGDELQRLDAVTLESGESTHLEDAGSVEFVDSAA